MGARAPDNLRTRGGSLPPKPLIHLLKRPGSRRTLSHACVLGAGAGSLCGSTTTVPDFHRFVR